MEGYHADSSSSRFRTLEEARTHALQSLAILEGTATRNNARREIDDVQCVVSPSTRGLLGDNDTLMYVFNFSNNAGFSIISANKACDPLIAVTEKGHYLYGEASGIGAFDKFMQGVTEMLENEEEPEEPEGPVDPETPGRQGTYPRDTVITYQYNNSVLPLIPVIWGQTGIYGQYCPNGISGCVATAVGQIMSKFQSPSSFVASVAMGSDFSSGSTVSLPWTYMVQHVQNHSDSLSCNSAHKNIGALLREIGKRVHMVYYEDCSGAYSAFVPYTLTTFGYVSDALSTATISGITSSLDNGRPVYLSGYSDEVESGHAWVCDGYIDYSYTMEIWEVSTLAQLPPAQWELVSSDIIERHVLHFNWGWDGYCNGYYNFGIYGGVPETLDDPMDSSDMYSFSNDVEVITNIRPNT